LSGRPFHRMLRRSKRASPLVEVSKVVLQPFPLLEGVTDSDPSTLRGSDRGEVSESLLLRLSDNFQILSLAMFSGVHEQFNQFLYPISMHFFVFTPRFASEVRREAFKSSYTTGTAAIWLRKLLSLDAAL
jgi:hypothetical protein